MSFITCLYRFLQPNYRPFIVITIKIASSPFFFLQCSYLLLRHLFCCCFFLNSIISVYCLLPAAPCSANTFFCHSNMCINNSLVCNGVQNCVYPWDENHCKGNHLLSEVTGRLLWLIRIFKNVFQGWCSIFLFVHFFHFLFIYFSYSLLISPHPLPPSREAIQGTFSSDH